MIERTYKVLFPWDILLRATFLLSPTTALLTKQPEKQATRTAAIPYSSYPVQQQSSKCTGMQEQESVNKEAIGPELTRHLLYL